MIDRSNRAETNTTPLQMSCSKIQLSGVCREMAKARHPLFNFMFQGVGIQTKEKQQQYKFKEMIGFQGARLLPIATATHTGIRPIRSVLVIYEATRHAAGLSCSMWNPLFRHSTISPTMTHCIVSLFKRTVVFQSGLRPKRLLSKRSREPSVDARQWQHWQANSRKTPCALQSQSPKGRLSRSSSKEVRIRVPFFSGLF